MTAPTRLIFGTLLVGLLAILGAGCSKEAKKAGHWERANRDFAAQDFPSAELEYQNVLALERTNRVAIRNLAHIYSDRGDTRKAFAFLNEAKRLETNDLGVRFKLGLLFLAGGKTNECRTEVGFILKANPGHEGGLQLLVELARTRQQLDDLQKYLLDLRNKLPNEPGVPLALGTLLLRKSDLKAAEAEFQKALALNPKSSEAHQGLGHVAYAQKDLKRAEQEYQTASELAPLRSMVRLRHADVRMLAGDPEGGRRLLEELARKAPDYIPVLNRLVELTFFKKEYDECEALIRRVLALDSMNFDALSASPRVKLVRGQHEKAVAEAKRLVQAYPRSPLAQYQLGLTYLGNKDTTNAMSSLRQALTLDRTSASAALVLADLHLRRGEFPSAITVLQPLTESGGTRTNEPALLLLARAYVGQRNLEEALKLYRRLAGPDSKNPEIPYNMGLILISQKKPAEARTALEAALALAPDYSDAVAALVGLDLVEKKYEPATERVKSLMARNPKAPEPVFLMAQVHAARRDNAQYEAALKKSIELDSTRTTNVFTEPYLALARFYAKSKREADAEKQLKESLSRNPRDRSTLMLLGMVQSQMGNYPKARATYEQLLASHPDFVPALNNLAFLYAKPAEDKLFEGKQPSQTDREQLDKAYQLAQKARARFLEHAVIADTYGWILLLRGDPTSALNPLRESAAKLTADPEVRYHLGMAQYLTGDESSARVSLGQALNLNDEARAKDAEVPDLPGRAEAERCLAVLALDVSKPDAAVLSRLSQEASRNPQDPVVARRLAALYEAQGDWDKARSTYEGLLKTRTNSVLARLRLAKLQSERFSEPATALRLAREARELDPADPQVAYELGRLAYRAGDQKWALSLLQESRLKNPNDSAVLYELSLVLYGMSRIPEAVTAMKDAVEKGLDPAKSAAAKQFLALASLFERPAEAERAASQIQDALGKNPDDAPALMAAAVLYAQKASTVVAAQQACSKLLKSHPFFAPALALLARLQSEPGGDLKEAYRNAQKAREILPADAEVAKTLGMVAYRRGEAGDSSRAVDLLKESSRKKPQDAETQYYLGLAHNQLNQKNEARQALTRALELKLDPKLAEHAQRVLASLK